MHPLLSIISNPWKHQSTSTNITISWYENLVATTCQILGHSCLHQLHLELLLRKSKYMLYFQCLEDCYYSFPTKRSSSRSWFEIIISIICLDLWMMYHLELRIEILVHLLCSCPISTFKHEFHNLNCLISYYINTSFVNMIIFLMNI